MWNLSNIQQAIVLQLFVGCRLLSLQFLCTDETQSFIHVKMIFETAGIMELSFSNVESEVEHSYCTTHCFKFDNQISFSSTLLNVTTTFVVGQPITNDRSAGLVFSDTSSIQEDIHISQIRIRCFNLNAMLDLENSQNVILKHKINGKTLHESIQNSINEAGNNKFILP